MAPKRGPISRRGKDQRQGGPRQGGRPQQRAGQGQGPGPRGYSRQRPNGRRPNVGPTACPMCGAVVSDLKGHIRQRHDDPESHPRQ